MGDSPPPGPPPPVGENLRAPESETQSVTGQAGMGFLKLGTPDLRGWGTLCWGGAVGCCRMLSRPHPYPPGAGLVWGRAGREKRRHPPTPPSGAGKTANGHLPREFIDGVNGFQPFLERPLAARHCDGCFLCHSNIIQDKSVSLQLCARVLTLHRGLNTETRSFRSLFPSQGTPRLAEKAVMHQGCVSSSVSPCGTGQGGMGD